VITKGDMVEKIQIISEQIGSEGFDAYVHSSIDFLFIAG
jgi:hypothetical protein